MGEASFLATGFGRQSKEVISRLYATNKYKIAELACYVDPRDPQLMSFPWKMYPATPHPQDQQKLQRYHSSPFGQFGETAFEEVCLDFKPDIIIDARDNWMSAMWQLRSPFRPYFKMLIVPTVDGFPQKTAWVEDYEQVDRIVALSQFGADVLKREAPHVKVYGVWRAAVNPLIHKPLNKQECRRHLGVPEDSNVLMMVARNQKRKLFPDLLEIFKKYIDHCVEKGNKELATNTYLYLHTSFPDVGFDIGRQIMQNNLGHRILLTYKCDACRRYYADFFQTELNVCKYCGNLSSHATNTQSGIADEDMTVVYNSADLVIQLSSCEGLGMPLAEAKSCGIPVAGMDCSAISEQVNIQGCISLKVGKLFHESVIETEQVRALPDEDDTIKKVYQFFTLPADVKKKYGELARKDAVENYSFDRSAKVFEDIIDELPIHDPSLTWDFPQPRYININQPLPKFSSNSEYVDWLINNLSIRPRTQSSEFRNDLIKGLNIGFIVDKHIGGQRRQCTHQTVYETFIRDAQLHNMWENARTARFRDKTQILWEKI